MIDLFGTQCCRFRRSDAEVPTAEDFQSINVVEPRRSFDEAFPIRSRHAEREATHLLERMVLGILLQSKVMKAFWITLWKEI